MPTLIECTGCGGLKRLDSWRCPHCQRRSGRSRWLRAALAVFGLGATGACGGSVYSPDAGDSGSVYSPDAYGAPPFRDAGTDAGITDGGDGGKSD